MARPPIKDPKTERLEVRMQKRIKKKLRNFATEKKVSMSEMVTRLIDEKEMIIKTD